MQCEIIYSDENIFLRDTQVGTNIIEIIVFCCVADRAQSRRVARGGFGGQINKSTLLDLNKLSVLLLMKPYESMHFTFGDFYLHHRLFGILLLRISIDWFDLIY